MSRALRAKLPGLSPSDPVDRYVGVAGKYRRIQIVSEVKAQGSNRCLVTHPQANSMGDIVVVTLQVCALLQAHVRVGLVPSAYAGKHLLGPGKYIPHIVKNRKADLILEVGYGDAREPQLQIVQKHRAAPDRKPGKRIARSRLI